MTVNTVEFIHDFRVEQASTAAVYQAKRCLLDLIGVAAAGSTTPLSRIIREHAAGQFGAGLVSAPMFFDRRQVSPVGSALANGMTIDSFDAHDGHPVTKGHAGCGSVAGLLAFADKHASGAEFLADLIVGYEIAIRAGLALHDTVTDYHTSGAWVALGVAAIGARRMGLNASTTREALGIAEYHGPRSQMMRCIDHPTMVKDGSGWGAMAGVSSALLARDGFTGAPAITVEADEVCEFWLDLGTRWTITEQYLKPMPICRWAQPPMEAARQLLNEHDIDTEGIGSIDVRTFHEASRLATPEPCNTEQAQYSLPFTLAAFLVNGKVGPAEIGGQALTDPQILRLSRAVRLIDDPDHSAKFPAERWADLTLTLKDGRVLRSEPAQAHGNADNPLTDDEISGKFHSLMSAADLGGIAHRIENEIAGIEKADSINGLLDALATEPQSQKLAGPRNE